MKPKEILEKLNTTADRIKYFKRGGIFTPENPPCCSKSTNYTDRDYFHLLPIVCLTQLGLTCGDIKKVQKGSCKLERAILERRDKIRREIERKTKFLELLSQLLGNKPQILEFESMLEIVS